MTLSSYVYERRHAFAKAAGVTGGVYLAGSFVSQRLGDMRENLVEERVARENIRRRFAQNEQDASYMALGLLPTLAEQILDGMDVEALTRELQSRSRSGASPLPAAPMISPAAPAPPPDPPLSSSTANESEESPSHEPRAASELAGSTPSLLSYPDHTQSSSQATSSGLPASMIESIDLSKSSTSWVHEFDAQSRVGSDAVPPSSSASVNEDLSNSVTSSIPSISSATPNNRTKAELWREVKMLTFTRTLTALYSTTLLTLFTHLQLSLLNRIKYVQSVHQLDFEERERESYGLSSPSKLLPTPVRQWLTDDSIVGGYDTGSMPLLGPESEMKFLTMSWWLLHVGWKDVGERVRRAVEEVFDEVSLKEQLSPMQLHRLLIDVRRRVEHEVTFEGKERRINFETTLLPSTPETLHHVLTKAGLRVAPPPHLHLPAMNISASSTNSVNSAIPDGPDLDPSFTALLAETATVISSPNFSKVVEAALDHISEELLLSGVLANVFGRKQPDEEEASQETAEPRMRLAAMLPGLARWSRLALTGLPNELVNCLGELREVKALSAIVFTSFAP